MGRVAVLNLEGNEKIKKTNVNLSDLALLTKRGRPFKEEIR
jgi:hypothetical protein